MFIYSVQIVILYWTLLMPVRQIIVCLTTKQHWLDTRVTDMVFCKQARLSNLNQISNLNSKDYSEVKGESISLFRCTQKRWEGLFSVSSDAYLVLPRQNIMTYQFGVVSVPLAYPWVEDYRQGTAIAFGLVFFMFLSVVDMSFARGLTDVSL